MTHLERVEAHYSDAFARHGATGRGVDWRDDASQELRFAQLLRIVDPARPFTLLDFGCGYGALADALEQRGWACEYVGADLSRPMLAHARSRAGRGVVRRRFLEPGAPLVPADYVVASGTFNVRLETGVQEWHGYVLETLAALAALASRGLAFNLLTSYSEPERMRDDLFYAEPGELFAFCKGLSRHVALLHDYGLWEFTMLVRNEQAP